MGISERLHQNDPGDGGIVRIVEMNCGDSQENLSFKWRVGGHLHLASGTFVSTPLCVVIFPPRVQYISRFMHKYVVYAFI